MLPGIEMMACPGMAVSPEVMQHVVQVESSQNPYAIGVVGGRLVRQPRSLDEAVATAEMLEERGYNFSIGLGQVNRYNLQRYGLDSYRKGFDTCANLRAASEILSECYGRSGGDWGKSFSCYYSGNFETGFRHGYVQKIYASMARERSADATAAAIPLAGDTGRAMVESRSLHGAAMKVADSLVSRRVAGLASSQGAAIAASEEEAPEVPPMAAMPAPEAPVQATVRAAPAAGADDVDTYVIRKTGAGTGVAVPASAMAAGTLAAPRVPQLPIAQQRSDNAFVF